MLNVAVLSGDDYGHKSSALIRKFDRVQLIGISAGHNELTEKMLQFQAEKLLEGAQAVYFDQFHHRFELFRTALRNRSHLFCNSLPDFSLAELKLLLNLQHEAGSVVQLLVPPIFAPSNLKLIEQIKAPFLANVRLAATLSKGLEQQLLNLLMTIVFLDKSEFRKIDLMSIPGTQGFSLIEIRLVFTSGSVARLLISDQLKDEESEIEIFPDNKYTLRLDNSTQQAEEQLLSEENAFAHFVKTINGHKSLNIGLQQVIQAKFILHAIQARLNLSGKFIDKKRFAV